MKKVGWESFRNINDRDYNQSHPSRTFRYN